MGRRPIGKVAMTAAERVQRWRQKHGLDKPKPASRPDAALVQELAQAKARVAELEKANTALKAELHDTLAARFAPKPRAVKPKVEKPPLPPDEARERTIKGLRTRVRNLTQELEHYHQHMLGRLGIMSRKTRIAIDKVVHPDTRDRATEEERDEAAKGWNAWKNDNDKARRRHGAE
jgi:hypothetical protein